MDVSVIAQTILLFKMYLKKIWNKSKLVISLLISSPLSSFTLSPVYSVILGSPTVEGRSLPVNSTNIPIIIATTDAV